jgi:hypothetical protein
MKIIRSDSFERDYQKLSIELQRRADKPLGFFLKTRITRVCALKTWKASGGSLASSKLVSPKDAALLP